MGATYDLGSFTSYELGKVADAFRAEAATLPRASAVHVLRRVCVASLVYDQRYATPWDDPTFAPRVRVLRDAIADTHPDTPAHLIEARAVNTALDELVAALEARNA